MENGSPPDETPKSDHSLPAADDTSTQSSELQADRWGRPTPTQIGPYRILELISDRGGMGDVYLAEQQAPIKRRVALKIIKLGMNSQEVLARFESERQILAVLTHPGIARIFDAGVSADGRPYFVMEYVPGMPITEYCDRHRLSTKDRLKLFTQVCQAIHHGHQKGIIHRDLKPSNILVAIQDGEPVAKVIDFGVAKALEQRMAEETVFTQRGVIIGTPEYMSPEQAEMSELGIDITTDIYSLGVLLYELLVGVLPIDSRRLRSAGYAEMLRLIREEDPPRLTMRLTTLGEHASEVAKHRGVVPETLRKQLRGDLEWIVLHALEKDRTRRYPSASEFAGDITHYFQDEPVSAGPPTARYKLRKILRRHRNLALATAGVIGALALGLAISTLMYVRAEQARRQARWESYKGNLYAADAALLKNRAADARQRLAVCPEEYRGWEWRHLAVQADGALQVLDAKQGPLYDMTISPDGRTFATAGDDGSVKIWDLASKKELLVLKGHSSGVHVVRFSPAGNLVATGGWDRTVRLWETSTGRQLAALTGHSSAVMSLSFSSDGNRLVSAQNASYPTGPGSRGEPLTIVWDVTARRELERLKDMTDEVLFVPGTYTLVGITATLGWASSVGIREDGSTKIRTLESSRTPSATDFSLSPDGSTVYVNDWGVVEVFNLRSGEKTGEISLEHLDLASVMRVTNDGQMLIVTSNESVFLVPVERGLSERRLAGHEGRVSGLSQVGSLMLTASVDGSVRFWDMHYIDGHMETQMMFPGTSLCFFANDGKILCSSTLAGSIKPPREIRERSALIFDRVSGLLVGLLPQPDQVTCVAVAPEGTFLATGCRTGQIQIWRTAGLDSLRTIKCDGPVASVCFTSSGEELVTCETDGSIATWDVSNGRRTRLFHLSRREVRKFTVVPRKPVAVLWDRSGVMALNTVTGDSLWGTAPKERANCFSVSRDGAFVAVATHPDGRSVVSIRSAESGATLWKRAELKSEYPVDLAFSPDGTRLVVLHMGGRLSVLETRGGEELLTMPTHLGPHDAGLVFSNDGSVLAGSNAGEIYLEETRSSAMDHAAREAAWETRRQAGQIVHDIMGHVESVEEARTRLREDRSLSADLREACELGAQLDGGRMLNDASWEIARARGRSHDEYLRAIRMAQGAVDANPTNDYDLNTLGVALYRVGNFADAVRKLELADSLAVQHEGSSSAANLIPLAMAYWRLDRRGDATATLEKARTLAGTPTWANSSPDIADLMKEAEALIHGGR
jgi:eukaryotic-like serine/threonine-protein kinase